MQLRSVIMNHKPKLCSPLVILLRGGCLHLTNGETNEWITGANVGVCNIVVVVVDGSIGATFVVVIVVVVLLDTTAYGCYYQHIVW